MRTVFHHVDGDGRDLRVAVPEDDQGGVLIAVDEPGERGVSHRLDATAAGGLIDAVAAALVEEHGAR